MSGSLSQFLAPLTQLLGIAEGAGAGVLPAIVAQLEAAGLAGTHPLTPEDLATAFTPEQLNDWALRAGTTPEALLAEMSRLPPAGAPPTDA